MNLKQSFRQTLEEARSNPGFTALYIAGVAFAVAFTMVFAILFHVRLSPVYPEYNRNNTVYIKGISVRNESQKSESQSSIAKDFVTEVVDKLENYDYYVLKSGSVSSYVQPRDGSSDFESVIKYVDTNFFKLYEYEFVAGRPFSESELQSGVRNVVITRDLANRLYGSAEAALENNISAGFIENRIVGIVKPGTSLFSDSFAQIFLPYTVDKDFIDAKGRDDQRRYLGYYQIAFKVRDNDQEKALESEIKDVLQRVNASDTTGWATRITQMGSNAEITLTNGYQDQSLADNLRIYLSLFFVLLIIPAINISGMIGGQMDRRMVEMALRRSFGGSKSSLCRQVMFENLLLTLAGGLFGLVVAWILIYSFKGTILQLVGNNWDFMGNIVDVSVSSEMLFAPTVFAGALVICVILNLLSAYIPVRFALRRSIVSTINAK